MQFWRNSLYAHHRVKHINTGDNTATNNGSADECSNDSDRNCIFDAVTDCGVSQNWADGYHWDTVFGYQTALGSCIPNR